MDRVGREGGHRLGNGEGEEGRAECLQGEVHCNELFDILTGF